MKQTSLLAYQQIQLDGTIPKQSKQILETLNNYLAGLTRNELSLYAGIRINSVCGRIKELLNLGYVKEEGKKRDEYTNKENYIIKKMG